MGGNPCKSCHIEEKVHVCCARHPAGGAQKDLLLPNGRSLSACPCLGMDGICRIYQGRPGICRNFFCERYDTSDMSELWDRTLFKGLYDGWDDP